MFRQACPRPSSRTLRRRQARQANRRRFPRAATPFLLFALAIGLGLPAYSATDSFSGPNNGDYGTSANWNSGAGPVPGIGNTDDAVNTTLNAINFNSTATINSFTGTGDGTFTVAGGTLSGSQASAASTFSNDNATMVSGGTLNNLTINAGAHGQGVAFTGTNSLDNAVINSTAAFNSGDLTFVDELVTLNGAATLAGANLHLNQNNTGGTLNINGGLSGDGLVDQRFTGLVNNNSTINADTSGKTLQFNVSTLDGNGTFEATNGGTLSLNTLTTNTGTLAASGGGNVTITGALNAGTGTTVNVDNSAGSVVQLSGGSLTGTIAATTGTGLTIDGASTNLLTNVTMAAGTQLTFTAASGGKVQFVDGTDTINGALALNGGSLHLNQNNDGGDLIVNSTLTGFGTVDQRFTSQVDVNGTLNATGTAGNPLNVAVSTLNVNGTAEATGAGGLVLSDTTNDVVGTIKANGGDVTFNNGTLQAFAGSNFLAGANTILITNGATVTGEILSATGSGLTFDGATTNTLHNLTLDSGTLTFTAASGGNVQFVDGTDTVNGRANLNGGSLHLNQNNDGGDLVLTGTGSLVGNGLVDTRFASTVDNGGLVNATGALAFNNGGGLTFNNTGTAEATGGPLTFNVATLNNEATGVIHAAGGDVTIENGTLNATAGGKFQADAGHTITLTNETVNGSVSSASGSGLTFSSSLGNNLLKNVTFDAGTLAFGASTTFVDGGTNTFNGAATLAGGDLQLNQNNDGADLIVNSTLTGFGTVGQRFASQVDVNGALNATGTAGNPLNVAVSTLNVNGTAEATGAGGLVLSDTNNNVAGTGVVRANGGDVAISGGTLTSAAGSTYDATGGTITVTNAVVTGEIGSATGSGLTFGSGGANNELRGLTFDAGTLAFGASTTFVDGGTNTFNGAATLAGGVLQLNQDNGGGVLAIGATGSLAGNGTVGQRFSGATTNAGTMDASAGTLNVNTDTLNNTGTLQAENGATLSVTSNTTDNGSILVKTGGTETFSQAQGLTQTTGKTQVDGTLNVASFTLAGGLLDGTGTVNSSVNNTGGTVKAGDSPGTLTFKGDYTQAAGPKATLLDEIAGFTAPNYGLLDVTGNATFAAGSILDVSLVNGFMPDNSSIGTIIPFLDYGTLDANALSNLSVDSLNRGYAYSIGNDMINKDLFLTVTDAPAPVVIPPTTAVPEPSSLALLGLGGFALLGVARRRRSGISA